MQPSGAFLSFLNYEIRTPLSGALGMLDLLLETPLSPEQREYAEAARMCTSNLHDLLHCTLEFAALEAGLVNLEKSPFRLSDSIRSLLGPMEEAARAKGLEFAGAIGNDCDVVVEGDAVRFREVCSHLVNSAIRLTPEGRVNLALECHKTGPGMVEAACRVSNTGKGLRREDLRHILEPFGGSSGSYATARPGLGLALTLASRLVRMMGGRLGYDSQPIAGTVFVASVPFPLAHHEEFQSPNLTPPRAWSILVVEDDPVSRKYLSHVLSRAGLQVDCVSQGEKAVQMAGWKRYSLILMDLQIDGLDGFEATRQVRALPEYKNVPIVALTAACGEEYRRACLNAGMAEFLSKPVDARRLVELVHKYIPECGLAPAE